MKKAIYLIFLLGSLCLPSAMVGAAEYKVGFVNVAQVLEKAPQADDARSRLEKEFAPRDRELVSLQKTIRKLEDKLVRDSAVMSDSEQSRVEREVRAKKRELKRQQDEFREDLNLRRNQELGKLQRNVLEAIQALAKKDNYDLIVSDGVIFASSRVEITDQIVDKLKNDFKAK